jgi:hypothetical protein
MLAIDLGGVGLDLENLHRFDDLIKLVEFSLAAARADFAGLLPGILGPDVGIPKGPSAALARAGLVDFAFAGHGIEKDAIAVFVLDQALSDPHFPHVLGLKIGHRHADLLGKLLDLFLVYPNVSGSTRAAIAALGTLESEAILKPRLFHRFPLYL